MFCLLFPMKRNGPRAGYSHGCLNPGWVSNAHRFISSRCLLPEWIPLYGSRRSSYRGQSGLCPPRQHSQMWNVKAFLCFQNISALPNMVSLTATSANCFKLYLETARNFSITFNNLLVLTLITFSNLLKEQDTMHAFYIQAWKSWCRQKITQSN